MPRRGPAPRRELLSDPVHGDKLVTQFVNKIMLQGKKSTAEKIVYDALEIAGKKSGKPGLVVLKKAVENTKPHLEVKPRRVGGATYQVPIEVDNKRGTTLSIRWLVGYARDRREKTMAERLAIELVDAAGGTGTSVKKKEDTHKMAEANKAFSHYRW
ncbi:MAG: 30S ribosomal protein S7 [Actinomycetota bacterium]